MVAGTFLTITSGRKICYYQKTTPGESIVERYLIQVQGKCKNYGMPCETHLVYFVKQNVAIV